MHLQGNTSTQWEAVIADLTAKRQTTLAHLEQLRAEKRELALDSALGSEDARRRLSKIAAELNRLALEADETEMALASATAALKKAEAAANDQAELERKEAIRSALTEYYTVVQNSDRLMEEMVRQFADAKRLLDSASDRMTGTERQAVSPVRRLFGATVAAAHAGLGQFVELGPTAAYANTHGRPLAVYTLSVIDGWIKRSDANQPEEEPATEQVEK